MSNIAKSLTDLIGNTPLLNLGRYCAHFGLEARLLAKLEYRNPAGSAKDRIAKSMIEDAEERGLLSPGGLIVEPTSGNTGIGLAAVAAAKGYRVILTMPESMSVERRALLKAYGAELILTEAARGMAGAIEKAEELARDIPGAFLARQFENPANPKAHRDTTGPEIWADTEGAVDIFVACVGTGGTVSGVGAYLKGQNPSVRVAAVEPYESSVLSGELPGPHKIQGTGAGFVPKNMDMSICDEIVRIKGDDALAACKTLARTEGLLAGISSGAALLTAKELALRPENKGKTIVVLLPDSGERYLSVPGYL